MILIYIVSNFLSLGILNLRRKTVFHACLHILPQCSCLKTYHIRRWFIYKGLTNHRLKVSPPSLLKVPNSRTHPVVRHSHNSRVHAYIQNTKYEVNTYKKEFHKLSNLKLFSLCVWRGFTDFCHIDPKRLACTHFSKIILYPTSQRTKH